MLLLQISMESQLAVGVRQESLQHICFLYFCENESLQGLRIQYIRTTVLSKEVCLAPKKAADVQKWQMSNVEAGGSLTRVFQPSC